MGVALAPRGPRLWLSAGRGFWAPGSLRAHKHNPIEPTLEEATARMPVRGVRGATTVTRNQKDEILDVTTELLKTMLDVNGINTEDIASCWITTTPDVFAEFPAVAARHMGWTQVPLMQSHEMSVPGMLPLCIRVLLHWNTEKTQSDIRHVYLREAARLRPDLSSRTFSTAR